MTLKTCTRSAGAVSAYAHIQIRLSQDTVITASGLNYLAIPINVTAAADGSYTVQLQANGDLTPTGTFYTLTEFAGTTDFTYYIQVPTSAGPFAITSIQVSPLPTVAASPTHVSTLTVDGPDPWFDVKSAAYGARGDGTTDDAVAIQAAINAAQSAGGGTIWIPLGTYIVGSDPMITGNQIQVRGAGWGAILKAKAATSVNCLKISGATGTTIRDLAIDGNKANTNQPGIGTQYVALNGVYVTGSTDVNIIGCRVLNCYEGGILCDSSNQIQIADCRLSGTNDNQIFIRPGGGGSLGCTNVTVSGCIVTGGAYSGIQAIHSDYVDFHDNICSSNGPSAAQGDGLGFEGCTYSVMTGNVVIGNGIQGLNVRRTIEGGARRSSQIVLSGNVAYNHTSSNGDAGGISITDSDEVDINGNLVVGNYYGVTLGTVASSGVTLMTLAGNHIRNNTNLGINATTGAGPVAVLGNHIRANGSSGLYSKIPLMSIEGNVFATNTGDGINFDTGASSAWVIGNHFYDNSNNGTELAGTSANIELRNNVFSNTANAQARACYEGGSAGPTRIVGNRIVGQSTEDFHLVNGSSVARDNDCANKRDTNSGSATIAPSGTSIAVTHGLWTTPTRVEITPTADAGSAFRLWVSGKGTTQFTINASPAVTNSTTFDWRAWTWDS